MRPRLGVLFFLVLLVSVGVRAQNNPLVGTWMGIPGDGDRRFRAIVITIPG